MICLAQRVRRSPLLSCFLSPALLGCSNERMLNQPRRTRQAGRLKIHDRAATRMRPRVLRPVLRGDGGFPRGSGQSMLRAGLGACDALAKDRRGGTHEIMASDRKIRVLRRL